jgi:hypothetical protein
MGLPRLDESKFVMALRQSNPARHQWPRSALATQVRFEAKMRIEERGVTPELSGAREVSWREDVVIAIRELCHHDVEEPVGFGTSRIGSSGAMANGRIGNKRLTSTLAVHA